MIVDGSVVPRVDLVGRILRMDRASDVRPITFVLVVEQLGIDGRCLKVLNAAGRYASRAHSRFSVLVPTGPCLRDLLAGWSVAVTVDFNQDATARLV